GTGTALNAPIATWTFRAGEQGVDKGPGVASTGGGGRGVFNFSPGQWNQTSVTLTVGSLSLGPFLFTQGQNPGVWSLNSNAQKDQGVGIIAAEALVAGTTTNTQFISGGANTPGFDALNTIFNGLLPGASAFGFATNFGGLGATGGPSSDFNPSSSSSGS